MTSRSQHISQRMLRRPLAAGMVTLYLAILFSPLASFATQSAMSSSVAARECSGDCNICGCSPESRATNTCCCSKKRQQQAHLHYDGQEGTADCCKKKTVEKKTVIACGCPCGDKKQASLSTGSSTEILPFHFAEQLHIAHTDTTYTTLTQRLTARHGEPPDPPPKLV